MARSIKLKPSSDDATLDKAYMNTSDPVEQKHWYVLSLLNKGKPAIEVAKIVGYSPYWVGQIAKRYNAAGREGTSSHANKPLLSKAQQEKLRTMLAGPAPDGGPWTASAVAQWMSNELGRRIREQRAWEYMERLPLLLTEAQQEKLRTMLAGPTPDGGPWTASAVAQWMSNELGRRIREQRAWEYMERLPLLLTEAQQEKLRTMLAGPTPDGGPWTASALAQWMLRSFRQYVPEQRAAEYMEQFQPKPPIWRPLSKAQQEKLRIMLAGPAPDGGPWTASALAQWMLRSFRQYVPEQRAAEYMERFQLPEATLQSRSKGWVKSGEERNMKKPGANQ